MGCSCKDEATSAECRRSFGYRENGWEEEAIGGDWTYLSLGLGLDMDPVQLGTRWFARQRAQDEGSVLQ